MLWQAASFGLSFLDAGGNNQTKINTGWLVSGLVTWIVFIVLVVVYVYYLRPNRPSFKVIPKIDGNFVLLRVINNGGKGLFKGTVKIEDGGNDSLPWTIQWRLAVGETWKEIQGQGDDDFLNLASREQKDGQPYIIFHDAGAKGTGGQILEHPLPNNKGEQVVLVTIKSNPPSREPWQKFQQRYKVLLTLNGIQVVELK